MIAGLLGKKLGMTEIFTESGECVPVTVLHVGPCTVLQVRTTEKDGYQAVQLGFEDKKRHRATRPETGHVKKADAEPKKFIAEVPWDGEDEADLGKSVGVEVFEGVKYVDVTGKSKGHGFTGVVRRHHFAGGPASHGQGDRHRSGGSIGQSSYPSRVFKGMRMPGHMGVQKNTVRNLIIVKIDTETNTIAVRGAVPGHNGSYITIRHARAQRRGVMHKKQ